MSKKQSDDWGRAARDWTIFVLAIKKYKSTQDGSILRFRC